MIQNIRGTQDILPGQSTLWHFLETRAREVFRCYGYAEMRTPILEPTELFQRSIGEATDIVSKEMYTFPDRKGRSLTLRPEGTASVVRACIQHKLIQDNTVLRLFYLGAMFRYERPQGGRQRQFHQVGVESIGSAHPAADIETMALLRSLFDAWGVPGIRFRINSTGGAASRDRIQQTLREWLAPHIAQMCPDCRSRYQTNVLRVYDCKIAGCRTVIEDLPGLVDLLEEGDLAHYRAVLEGLDALRIPYREDARLVRGLDYYTRTLFEAELEGDTLADVLAGGGRYDGLFSQLGSPRPVPAVGFAIGLERVESCLRQRQILPPESASAIFVAVPDPAQLVSSLALVEALRRDGFSVTFDTLGRSLKAQFRAAGKSGVLLVVMRGSEEIQKGEVKIKDLESGAERFVPDDRLQVVLRELLSRTRAPGSDGQ